MTVDWVALTPIHAAFGGALIGLAIAGIRGIAAGLAQGRDRLWRAAFLIGFVLSPLLLHGLPSSLDLSFANPTLLVLGAFIVDVASTRASKSSASPATGE